MIAFQVIFLFLLGTVFGSFAAAAAYRMPRRQDLGGRSHCPSCGTQIRARDNIPVLGWIFLRGRSSCCQTPISPRYLLIELFGGLIGVAFALAGLILPFIVGGLALAVALALLAEFRCRRRS